MSELFQTHGKYIQSFSIQDCKEAKLGRWIIKGFFRERELMVLSGNGGVGKTSMILHAVLSAVLGMPEWAGMDIPRKIAGAYMGFDMNPESTKYRIKEIVHGVAPLYNFQPDQHELDNFRILDSSSFMIYGDSDQTNTLKAPRPNFFISDDDDSVESVECLIDYLKDTGIQVLIIDLLSSVSGSAKENDNGDMGRVISTAKKIRDVTGATLIFLHHTAKGTGEQRGAGKIQGETDGSFTLIQYEENDNNHFKLKSNKIRFSGSKVIGLQVTWKPWLDPDGYPVIDDDGDQEQAYNIEAWNIPTAETKANEKRTKAEAEEQEKERDLIGFIGSHEGLTQNKLWDAYNSGFKGELKYHRQTFSAKLNQLKEDGKIRVEQPKAGNGNPMYYYVI